MAPETKVLLAGLLLRYPNGRFSSVQVQEHAGALGMSARIVRRSMLELIALCFVDAERVRQGRGQPMAHYELTEHLLGLLQEEAQEKKPKKPKKEPEKREQPSHVPRELIDSVLLADSPIGHLKGMQAEVKGRAGLQDRASASNRLLLAVLLCHADRFGMVAELGLAMLVKLTGLTRTRVEAQLFKLNQLGLIRGKVPGFSGSTLLGSPRTVYFLNLHHPDLAQPHSGAVVLLATSLKVEDEWSEAARIFNCAHEEHFTREADEGELVLSEGFDGLASTLCLQRNLANDGRVLYGMLQHLLDRYASVLLSRHWFKLASGKLFFDQSLLGSISLDVRVAGRSLMAREAIERGLSHFLYEVAFLLAVRVRRQLGAIAGVTLETMEFRLLPLPDPCKQSEMRALLALPVDASRPVSSQVLGTGSSLQSGSQEQDIPLGYRYACGLLTQFPAYARYTRQ